MFTIIKKVWHGILNFITWVTQDSAKINKTKDSTPLDPGALSRLRGPWR
jgi:hypothetical protein